MVLVLVLVLGQLADGLTYLHARSGIELNPFMAAFGVSAVFVKLAGTGALGAIALRLRRHPRILLWIAAVGWFGALTNFSGFG